MLRDWLIVLTLITVAGCASDHQSTTISKGDLSIEAAIDVVQRSIVEQQDKSLAATDVVIDVDHFEATDSRGQTCVDINLVQRQRITKKGSTYRVELFYGNQRRGYLLRDEREEFVDRFAKAIETLISYHADSRNNAVWGKCGLFRGESADIQLFRDRDMTHQSDCRFIKNNQCLSKSYRGRASCENRHRKQAFEAGANVVNIIESYKSFGVTQLLLAPFVSPVASNVHADYFFCSSIQGDVVQRSQPLPQKQTPPDPTGAEAKLLELKTLFEKGLITSEEYETKRSEIIEKL